MSSKIDILEIKYENFMKGRTILRGFKPKITVCRDKIGNLIAGEEHILNRWAEYFEELLSTKTTQCMNAETISALNYIYLCPWL
jgi:hypothetical protein